MDRKSWGSPSWIGSHGGRHLGSEVMGAAILDRKSWGPPSWTGSDVKCAIVAPILLISTTPVDIYSVLNNEKESLQFSDHNAGLCVLLAEIIAFI